MGVPERSAVVCVLLFLSTLLVGGASGGPAEDCAALLASGNSGRVTAAYVVPPAGDTPAYCRVTGVLEASVGYEVRLPTAGWNGKLLHVGGGGMGGSNPVNGGRDALIRGYATTGTDTGHIGSSLDGTFAYDNTQGEIDFAFRAVHVVTVAAKNLIRDFYGNEPQYSYFRGCSTGGRQALMEAHRFPGDFDGIIAGDPHPYYTGMAVLLDGWYDTVNRDAMGLQVLTQDKVGLISDAVYGACDGLDGLVDGIIDDARRCDFDPASIMCPGGGPGAACLSAAQVDVLRKFYEGPKNSAGELLYFGGLVKGGERAWPGLYVTSGTGLATFGIAAQENLRYMVFSKDPGPSYSLFDFNWDTDPAKLKAKGELYNPSSHGNMSGFKGRGGKLLMYTGWADPHNANGTVHYYDQMSAVHGQGIQEWFRFFTVPGMNHCSGGPGPNVFDMLTALENWVENGVAPERIIASHMVKDAQGNSVVDRTRPLCPYPMVARYTGSGSIDDAASFNCVEPDYVVPANEWDNMKFPWE